MSPSRPDERIIIIAPVGQDATAMATLLHSHGFKTGICEGPPGARRELAAGAASLLLTEEALELPGTPDLLDYLRAQPPWSELPLIVLTKGGQSRFVALLDLAATAAGSVTLIERPVGMLTLLRSVEVALRSRRRQYQMRNLLEQEQRKHRELVQTQETLKQAQEQLRQHAATLEKTVAERTHDLRVTNEQLEAFVYSIAHDLRSPLRSMIGYSQILLDDYSNGLQENARNLLSRIQASSEFMDKLLLDLLAFGRTTRSEMALDRVEVRKAWEAALFQCATQVNEGRAEIETVEPLWTVLAHEATLGQCLANLLGNALKFVPPDVQPRIRCSAMVRGDYVRVMVKDNGIGIPARDHERVFRVFERLNGSRYAGTGIGLSIVRKGVERMGGKVGLESKAGEGACFWIELPRVD